ncbi:cytochrome c biogenesis protein CcdA [Leucobacter rhizosphaerae]|uniref:Cytochrome c biogenesis protein CcdA n=1 Tax=Leucobacter rhizosphaerae TaxID=2932245 RepID=A0ABY4FRS6_9MICO|nr:cytochrome c biogenesis protein CcdA [Leucobacter rhizosphaerae]UOQ58965.1 cytochrome c biogenesis protein CcdA [Leucobacter rhizosphaerae]
MNLQEIVADGQLLVASLIALAAGLVSFLSPCVLPLVPGYLAYVGANAESSDGAGAGKPARRRLVLGSLLFVAGFTAVLVALMAAAGTIGIWLIEWEWIITRVMGVVVILMGIVFIGFFGRMQMTKKLRVKPRVGLLGAPLLGVVFAIGWTPCLGPTLATIMSLSLQQGSVSRSIVLALAYSLGLGIPFVLAAIGFGWMTRTMTFFKRHIRVVNLIGGGLLILIGLLMVTGLWSQMMFGLQAVIGGYVTPI